MSNIFCQASHQLIKDNDDVSIIIIKKDRHHNYYMPLSTVIYAKKEEFGFYDIVKDDNVILHERYFNAPIEYILQQLYRHEVTNRRIDEHPDMINSDLLKKLDIFIVKKQVYNYLSTQISKHITVDDDDIKAYTEKSIIAEYLYKFGHYPTDIVELLQHIENNPVHKSVLKVIMNDINSGSHLAYQYISNDNYKQRIKDVIQFEKNLHSIGIQYHPYPNVFNLDKDIYKKTNYNKILKQFIKINNNATIISKQ